MTNPMNIRTVLDAEAQSTGRRRKMSRSPFQFLRLSSSQAVTGVLLHTLSISEDEHGLTILFVDRFPILGGRVCVVRYKHTESLLSTRTWYIKHTTIYYPTFSLTFCYCIIIPLSSSTMTVSSNSALSAESLLNLMVKSLPGKASEESSPTIKDPYAAVGLFAHACMLAIGFRLIGLGEDHKIGLWNSLSRLHGLTCSQMHHRIRRMYNSYLPSGTLPLHMPFDTPILSPRWNF